MFSAYAIAQLAAGTGLPDPLYLAHFSTGPAADGTGGTELTSGTAPGYARVEVSWGAVVSKEIPSDAEVVFTATGDWPEATHGGLWDAASGGNLWLHDQYDEAFTLGQGDTLTLPIGDIVQRYL